jgi:hypothetical protein
LAVNGGNGGADTVGDGIANDGFPLPMVVRTAPKYDVGQGG